MNEVLEHRVTQLEAKVDKLQARDETITTLRVEIGKMQTQTKITWGLLTLVIGGLITVALSLWQLL